QRGEGGDDAAQQHGASPVPQHRVNRSVIDAEAGVLAADAGAEIGAAIARVARVEGRPDVAAAGALDIDRLVVATVVVIAAAAAQIVGRDPAVGAAALDAAPAAAAMVDIDHLATLRHINRTVLGAGAAA